MGWLDKIITFSETNSNSYFESPNSVLQTRRNIEKRIYQLKVELNEMNEQYLSNILFALMLINRNSGLSLYTHNFTDKSLDSDLIGGFLSAIQSFGYELDAEGEATMQKLSYKHFKIELLEGEYAVVALITSGIADQLTKERQRELLSKFESKFKQELETFTGEVGQFQKADEIVKKIFLS